MSRSHKPAMHRRSEKETDIPENRSSVYLVSLRNAQLNGYTLLNVGDGADLNTVNAPARFTSPSVS